MIKGRRNPKWVGRNSPAKRTIFKRTQLPDCELGPARCFFPDGFVAPYKIAGGKSSAKICEPPREKNRVGQAHSPAIELHLKIAPLAGLFRPTRRRGFTAETFRRRSQDDRDNPLFALGRRSTRFSTCSRGPQPF
jgi:hypothetical protein